MQLNRRLMVPLLAGVAAVSLVFAFYQARAEMRAMEDALQWQARVLAESQQAPVEQRLIDASVGDLQTYVDRLPTRGQFAGMAIYDPSGQLLAESPSLTPRLDATPAAVPQCLKEGRGLGEFFRMKGARMHVYALPLEAGGIAIGAVGIFHNAALLGAPVWRRAIAGLVETLLIVGLTLAIVRWSLGKPLRRMAEWLRELRTGDAPGEGQPPNEEMFGPLASEVTRIASSLHIARAAAEEEARLRDASSSLWTAERLRIAMQGKLNGSRLFAVSNREPYEHVRQGSGVVCSVPPSGLVTALEPVLRACGGVWIAQATGDADREATDENGRVRVPPDHPQYTLRRVWLSREEQEGFYFGFANEGLWPLCHIAHTRPLFRTEDWNHYQAVNRKFAAALLEEMQGQPEPLALIQDYHFALAPAMVKERRPDARIAIFWHIPWPNPEAFGICPWQRELLDGMLGTDLIGFHIQAHCNNFLATVDRALESRIDWAHFAVNRRGRLTTVRPFPISVEFNGDSAHSKTPTSPAGRAALFRQLGVEATFLGLGVDRVDYTKGIPERFRGIERLLDEDPFYREKLTFVQIGAPSRTRIKRYQDLMEEVEAEAERINRRFRTSAWRPIVFLKRHHSHEEILPHYREADFCLVTSLHDGMNLVAKEYIAARRDERGALILSRFTGASHELMDALVVNPYDADELARAIHTALSMPAEEQRTRMRRMRAVVQEHNVYRWAGNLIGELAEVRPEMATAGAEAEDRGHRLLAFGRRMNA
jgi:trehalose 6-phosphate synthase